MLLNINASIKQFAVHHIWHYIVYIQALFTQVTWSWYKGPSNNAHVGVWIILTNLNDM